MTEIYTGLTGDGVAVLAALRTVPRLGVELTTVPGGVAITSGGSPRRVMKAGWIAPSRIGSDTSWPTTLFCEDARWINFERQQISYGQPGVFADRVRYHLEPGVVASLYVNDSVPVPTLTQQLAPWDRNPEVAYETAGLELTATGSATLWSFTVPTGRILMLSHGWLAIEQRATATALDFIQMAFHRSGNILINVTSGDPTQGAHCEAGLSSGPIYVLPGETISATYVAVGFTGDALMYATASGTLFDA